MHSFQAPEPSSAVAKNLNLLTTAIFLLCGVLAGLKHNYFAAGVWAALGLSMGVAALAGHRKSSRLTWLAGALLAMALLFFGLEVRQDWAASQARRAGLQQAR